MKFRRSYFSAEEYQTRLGIFRENLEQIAILNSASDDKAEYGVGPFTDMSAEEF